MKLKLIKKLISTAILSTFLATTVTTTSVYAAKDISGHWAEEVLIKWSEEGLISGFSDDTLRPNDTVTRAQFVTMIQNILNLTPLEISEFSDVVETDWFYNSVKNCVSNGIATGFPDGTFAPEDIVTRAQAAVFGFNIINEEVGGNINTYIDVEDIPNWSKDYVATMTKYGYLSGMSDGSFDAEAPLTRAQAVSFLDRLRNYGTDYEENEVITVNNHYITGDNDTYVKNMSFDKNLVISDTVATDEVVIENVFVTGNIVINGGSSITIKNAEIQGSLIINNKNVPVTIIGNTNINDVEFRDAGSITSDRLTGKVGTINIPDPISTVHRVYIDTIATEVNVDGRSAVEVKKPIPLVNVNAESATLITYDNTIIDELNVNVKSTIRGTGTVDVFNANASEITYENKMIVGDIVSASGIVKPSMTSSSLTGSGDGVGTGATGTSNNSVDPSEVELNIDPIYDIFVYLEGEIIEDTGDYFYFVAGEEVNVSVNKNELPSNGFFSWQITCNCPGLFLSNEDKTGLTNVLWANVGAYDKHAVLAITYTYEVGGVAKEVVKNIPFMTTKPE